MQPQYENHPTSHHKKLRNDCFQQTTMKNKVMTENRRFDIIYQINQESKYRNNEMFKK